MPSSKIKIFKVDSNLFTGSADPLLETLNCTYEYAVPFSVIPSAELIEEIVKKSSTPRSFGSEFNNVAATELSTGPINYIQAKLLSTSSSDTIINKYKYAVRLIAKEEKYVNDAHWAQKVLGGNFAGETLEPLVRLNPYDVFGHSDETSYDAIEASEIKFYAANDLDLDTHEVGYRYNLHVPEYQTYAQDLSENVLPNVYFNEVYSLSIDDDTERFNLDERPYLEEFVSRGLPVKEYRNVHAPKELQQTETPPPYDINDTDRNLGAGVYNDKSLFLRSYLTGAFINNEIKTETAEIINNKSQNIFFSAPASSDILENIDEYGDDSRIERYPLYSRLVIPHSPYVLSYGDTGDELSSYSSIIGKNNLQEEVMSYIQRSFNGDRSNVESIEFVEQEEKLSVINDAVKNSISSQTKSNSAIDFLNMLVQISNNSLPSESSTQMFLTPSTGEAAAMINAKNSFRYSKTINGISAIEDTIENLNKSANKIYNEQEINESVELTQLMRDLRRSTDNRKPEVIAYKIDKLLGSPVGDNTEIRKLQTYMFFNTDALNQDGSGTFKFYDTQVKYNQQYTYIVNAYAVVEGYSYQYSDLVISRQIGDVILRDSDGNVIEPPGIGLEVVERNCIEFYDPLTNLASEQLLNEESNLKSSKFTPTDLLGTSALAASTGSTTPGPTDDLDLLIRYAAAVTINNSILSRNPLKRRTGRFSRQGLAYFDNILTDNDYKKEFIEKVSAEFVLRGLMDALTSIDASSKPLAKYNTFKSLFRIKIGPKISELYKKWAQEHINYQLSDLSWYEPNPKDSYFVPLTVPPYEIISLGGFNEANEYATNAQIKSVHKYMCDFHFELQPSLKIIEIPIIAKSISITDHPPVACDVVPYQRKDNSNVIGFYINKESFTNFKGQEYRKTSSKLGLYPTPMIPQEIINKEIYLSSNNIIENQIIKNKSVSHIAQVEIYRLNTRPTSLEDFADNLVFTKDLNYEDDTSYGITNCFYEEEVATNRKFYYLFKFVNANGETGYVSPVQVVELVDDGGYKYATFDSIFENSLVLPPKKQSSTNFKKLMQITPNQNHLLLNYDNVDFEKEASTQVGLIKVGNATELIWNKKFKFRLTSKKTGKKIDLNVTYKLRDS